MADQPLVEITCAVGQDDLNLNNKTNVESLKAYLSMSCSNRKILCVELMNSSYGVENFMF